MPEITAKEAVISLDTIQTQMEAAVNMLYALHNAMAYGNDISVGESAVALWGIWDYMGNIMQEQRKLIDAGVHSKK